MQVAGKLATDTVTALGYTVEQQVLGVVHDG